MGAMRDVRPPTPAPRIIVGVQLGALERWLEAWDAVRVVGTFHTTGAVLSTLRAEPTAAVLSALLDGDPPLGELLRDPVWERCPLVFLAGPWHLGRWRLLRNLPPGATVIRGRCLRAQEVAAALSRW